MLKIEVVLECSLEEAKSPAGVIFSLENDTAVDQVNNIVGKLFGLLSQQNVTPSKASPIEPARDRGLSGEELKLKKSATEAKRKTKLAFPVIGRLP